MTDASGLTSPWLSPPVAKRRLANKVRALRHHAGMTLDQAAPRLDLSRGSLHRLETGGSRIDVHLVRSMMDLYDHYEPDLLDIARAARARGWWHSLPGSDRDYLGWEAGAARLREVAVWGLPDLLVTQDYARTLLTEQSPPTSARDAWRDVRLLDLQLYALRQRQLRLTDPSALLRYSVVLDEAALRNLTGEPTLIRDQLAHLVEQAALPNVEIRILPSTAGARVRAGEFRVLTFGHAEDSPVAYIDYLGDHVHETRPTQVGAAEDRYRRIESGALATAESVAFIEQCAGEIPG